MNPDTTLHTDERPKRASRYIRPEIPRRFVLTPRDKDVIRAVNDYRVMRQDQIQRLYFPSKTPGQRRLQVLWQQGFLKRDYIPVKGSLQTSQTLYTIDKLGVQLLRNEFGYVDSQLRYSAKAHLDPTFINHTLGLSEVRLAIEMSCRKHVYHLATWYDEKAMKANHDQVQLRNGRPVAVVPDAYLNIELPSTNKMHFFVEYDGGTEHLKYLSQKLRAYWVYFQSGKCKARYGTDRIRVLTILTGGPHRLENIIKLLSDLTESQWFWFAPISRVQTDDIFVDPIWSKVGRESPLSLMAS